MTAAEETVQPVAPMCWCCGGEFEERELVRLGAHPEVGVCVGCAKYLQRRAAEREDELRPSRGARVQAALRGVREFVIGRGWHDLPVLGWLLRRIGRHLP
ncbi:hypothetical protein [Kribbella sp. DT2]|uniref:hypothetical protein n=1 Tax=Kribbella sp. DT2 TaxID=3393427 RepID=UPI003CF7F2EE